MNSKVRKIEYSSGIKFSPTDNTFNESRIRKLSWLAVSVILIVIILDQWLKIWVKTKFYLGEDLELTKWFNLKFIENNGFAFGLEWFNKYVLTFGRIIAVIIFVWLLRKFVRLNDVRVGFIVSFALIVAGAAGNIFDCVFYGEIFSDPYPPQVAVAFPVGGGYSGWFEGKVVDMLYFPLFSFVWPDWIPVIGGTEYEFFQYIFNIADASITIGVLMLIFFYSADAAEAISSVFNTGKSKKSVTE